MSQENKALLDRLNQVLNGADVALVDECMTEDFVEHNPMPQATPDREGFKQLAMSLRTGFSDFHTEVHRQIAEGDYVVEHWTSTGTHDGEFMGVAATGNRVNIEGMDISRFENGKIAEHWTQMDGVALMEQLGLLPAEARA